MVNLSIIIVSYNTADITRNCLDSIIASLKPASSLHAEILVLDNNSSDGSVEMLREYQKSLASEKLLDMHVIFSNKNLGFGLGNNEAVSIAKGEYLLFLNSDTVTLDSAIPDFLEACRTGTYTFAGARLLNKDMTLQPSVGRFYTLANSFIALFLFGDRWHFTRYSPKNESEVDWVSGACFMCKRSDYEKLGGFDPEIFMYWEEVDLFYRAHQSGMTVGFYPTPTFVHLEGASSSSRTAPILKVIEGYLFFYKKHYSSFHVQVIRYMLQLKSLSSLLVGKLIGNQYLISTYSKAYEITQKS